jgi:hypothetical protein
MRILLTNNRSFEMNTVPDEVEDFRYCVLDYSNKNQVDYIFIPLIFLESFSMPAAELKIGPHIIQMPLDWSLVIGEKELGEVEILPIKHLNDRDFSAFVFNPITGYMIDFAKIELINIYPDIKWYFPKLKHGHLLAVPLSMGENPLCAFFVHEVNKLPDILDISKLS